MITDSISQAPTRGEIFHALKQGVITANKIVELGAVILDPSLQRQSEQQITIADLTGLAVQDIQIARVVYNNMSKFVKKASG